MDLNFKRINILGKEAQYLQLNEEGVDAVFYSANGFPLGAYSEFLKQLIPTYKLTCLSPRACWPNIGSPPRQTNWETYADDLIDFMDQKFNKPIVAIGHSQGATAIVIAASKRPDLFKSLVLIEPASISTILAYLVKWTPYSLKKYFQPFKSGLEKQDIWESKETFFDDCKKNRAYRRINEKVLHDFVKYGLKPSDNGKFRLSYSAKWEASNYALAPSIWKYLRKINIPIQVIAGKPSLFFSQKLRDQWIQRSPNSTIEVKKEFGHLFPLESPEICGEMVRKEWS